jgi:hypothetical protein
MAEWSMAVVLKTSRIGYDMAVILCPPLLARTFEVLAIIAAL